MTSSVSRADARSPITIAAGFLGAFIVGSLAVQMVRHHSAAVGSGPSSDVAPVITSQAVLWSALGERDVASVSGGESAVTPHADVQLVVGSEATLWSPLAER